ncbi:DNA repair protein UVH3 [Morella rubra]|uniref:DNA repair protein UVH3 n=1 Tax=Morella rubra TaxID=262757 RepID=A0A6A1VIJ8_9ROSI|nr:DNA repair protein UVH3 [Morella rubra]
MDPAKFSELQIQAYLKTVAFRREIDEVQKSAAGRGVGGVQTSRIASEANREFIFSSSFTGDKQVLASAGAQRNGDNQPETPREHPSQSSINSVASTSKSNAMPSSGLDESTRVIDDNIETYLDERGRVRVSRVRAMGIRMTRDLQRNLDLMKEIEQESENSNNIENLQTMISRNKISVPRTFPSKNQSLETSHDGNCESVCLSERDDQFMVKNDASIEVSFEDDGFDGDDDLFAQLVAGNPVNISSADNTPSRKEPSNFHSHCSSEEGVIKEKVDSVSNDDGVGRKFSLEQGNISDDSDVEWEEGVCDFHKSTSLCQAESGRTVSKGHLQEEADLQEAIKRSLDYVRDNECSFVLPQDEKNHGEKVPEDTGLFDQRYQSGGKLVPEGCGTRGNESFSEILNDDEKPDRVAGITVSQTIDSSGRQLKSSVGCSSAISEMLLNKPHERYPGINSEQSMLDAAEGGNLYRETPCAESITPLETSSYIPSWGSEKNSCISDAICGAKMNDTEAEPVCHVTDMISDSPLMKLSMTDTTNEIDFHQNLAAEERIDNRIGERKHKKDNSLIEGNETLQAEVTEGDLEEEMLVLHQEYLNLGDEQRKLERNAESVNSEMFTECQELLQMFGLPYIIAPMEAEAQCAYLELANLVDGVVTDDSDVFLFGARSVYKNIFDDRKYVETYLMKDIEKELGLTREKLIRMALLLGSDYTEGISGIGIVNAFEVVNAFPEEDGLDKFREWIESPDPTILKKLDTDTGSSARKRGPKVSDNGLSCSKHNTEEVSASELNISEAQEQKQSESYMQDIKQIFMDKHRNVSKNWHIPSSFPSEAVISAYSSPQVDKSSEPFTWGKPDHFVLRKLCWGKFGWGSQKVDELLVPVLKEYDKHETQLRLEAFYTFNERFAKIRSKRIKKALKGVTGQQTSVLIDDPLPEVSRSKKKRGVSLVEPGDNKSEKPPDKIEESDGQNQSNYGHESTPKQSRKRRNYGEPVPSSEENLEPSTEAEVRQSRNRGSLGNGRGRGRGRGRRAGRGGGKKSSGLETCESSASDSDHDEQEALMEKFEAPDKVRRSARSRKPVNYTVNDFEVEDLEKSADQSEKKCSDDESLEQDLSSAQGVCGDAAAAGHNGKKQRHAEDPALEEGLHGDCLKIGGGFCTGECEISQPDVSQCLDPSQTEVPKDYLKIGGGFCLDEGEEENDQDGSNGPAAASAPGNADISHLSGFMDEGDLDSGSAQSNLLPKDALDGPGKTDAYNTESNQDHLNASSNDGNPKGYVDLPENRKGTTGTTTVGGLSAMPFLRRKRRKS